MDLEIGIYGNGIVGICLAAHLEKLNIKYKLITTRNELSDGYGLTIQDADNIIHYLGLKPELDKINYLQRFVKIDSRENIIDSVCHSKGNYVIPRIELKKLFNTLIKDENIITCSDTIKNIEDNEDHVVLTLSDERVMKFKYLIGCDGIKSTVREHIGITKEELLVETGYNINIYKFIKNSFYDSIENDVVEYVSPNNMLRLFIKPNGEYGASCQITYPSDLVDFKSLIPPNILKQIDFDNLYTSTLYSSKQISPPTNSVILLGDALHPMVPYNGMGANTAIINAHILALILKMDERNLVKQFYDTILDKSYQNVANSFNSFNTIHTNTIHTSEKHFRKTLKKDIYEYSPMLFFLPNPPNYRLNDRIIEFKNNFTEVVLAGAGLTTFPLELFSIDNLKVLNLNDNMLENIPSDIKIHVGLKELYLRNNKLKTLPDEVFNLQKLEILRLSYNELIMLPTFNLPKLRELCLTGNNLNTIPDSINNCTMLQKIYMSDNMLSEIPILKKLIKLKYFRLSNNTVLLEDIITKITNYQLLNLIEFKLSITQIDKEMECVNSRFNFHKIKYGSIFYFNRIVKNVYGCTLSKEERKKFKINKFNRDYTIVGNPFTTIDARWTDMTIFFLKVNLLKFGTKEFDILTNKMIKHICQPNNILLVLKLFTLAITQNIKINVEAMVDFLSRFINRDRLEYLVRKQRIYPFDINRDLTKIESIYKTNNMIKIGNRIIDTKNNHDGYPLHPIHGRPRYNHLKCLYENCMEEFTDTVSLAFHLSRNVPHFIGRYHSLHEPFIPDIIEKYKEDSSTIMKCPVECCFYNGDISFHFRQLGFKPFWKKDDIIKKNDEEPYRVVYTNECMTCDDNIPCVLFECGHRVLCLECGYKLICEKKSKACVLCSNISNNVFIH
jgi:flavin-dependent dehydrogenase